MAKDNEKDGVWRTVGGRRIFIRNGESLTDAMKKSGKFKKSNQKSISKTKKRDRKFGDREIKNDKDFETTREAMNSIAKQLNETKDTKQKATLKRVLDNYTKNLKEYQDKIAMENHQRREHADDNPTQKSIRALNEIDRLAGDNEYLQKKGRELGLKNFKQFLKDNPGYSKNQKLPERFKEGFKVQNSKYSDENKMSLVEDGSGVRLIYDGKDTGTVLRNDLSDSEITSLRNAGKIQNMSEYLGEKYSLNDKQLKTLHNHLESNIKAWREQGMSNQQILDMVSDRQEIAGDDGLYNLKGIDMDSKKTEVLNEYQSYIQNKISTKTKKDYDTSLEKINKIPTDGTYDLETGSSKDYSDGYQVTFSMTNMDFDDKTYQDLVEKFKTHDHGTVDAGKFDGYPEISFNVTDIKTAAKLATKYNQISIWDWKNNKEIFTKGTGEYQDYKPVTTETISKSVARTRGLQNKILNYEDEIKTLKRKSSLTFTDKQKLIKLQNEKEKLEKQLK